MKVISMILIERDEKTRKEIGCKKFYQDIDSDKYIQSIGERLLPILLENGFENLVEDIETKLHRKLDIRPTQAN